MPKDRFFITAAAPGIEVVTERVDAHKYVTTIHDTRQVEDSLDEHRMVAGTWLGSRVQHKAAVDMAQTAAAEPPAPWPALISNS